MLVNVQLPGADKITQMDDSELLKLEGGYENEKEVAAWIQYHLATTGEMVHRSAHVVLKEVLKVSGSAAQLG
jgi:hypothetical protein